MAKPGTHGCNYLLTVNIEMDPLDGFKLANWEKGFGDFEMRPDLATLRVLPWQPGAALVFAICIITTASSSRKRRARCSRGRLDRLASKDLTCNIASELEFFLFNKTYDAAFASDYTGLTPSSDYRIDYHTMQPTRDEPIFRAMRNRMEQAGVPIESARANGAGASTRSISSTPSRCRWRTCTWSSSKA